MADYCADQANNALSAISWHLANEPHTSLDEMATLGFWIKILLPMLVTGSLAGYALVVSLSQRKIASNKYILDLFDRRFDSYYAFKKHCMEINKLYGKSKNVRDEYKDFIVLMEDLKKCLLLFVSASEENDSNPIVKTLKWELKCESLKSNISFLRMYGNENTDSTPSIKEFIDGILEGRSVKNAIYDIEQEYREADIILPALLTNCDDYMWANMKLAHQPF